MDYYLTPEQQELQEMVRDFVAQEITPISAEMDITGTFPMEVHLLISLS